MDSSHWSATRAARRVVALRDEVLERLPRNPIIRTVLASEFSYLHDHLRDRYMSEGYGPVPASAQAASHLGFALVPDMLDQPFETMGYLRLGALNYRSSSTHAAKVSTFPRSRSTAAYRGPTTVPSAMAAA